MDSNTGAICWHMFFRGNPAVRATAKKAQEQLARFRGLHMTPGEWLHATALVAGTTEDTSAENLDAMLSEARRSLANFRPIQVTLADVLYPRSHHAGLRP
jgi:hypothetical protein